MSKHFHNYGGHFNNKEQQREKVDVKPEEKVDVKPDLSEQNSHIEPKVAVVISRGKLNVRPFPSTEGEPITKIDPGTQLMVQSIEDGWAHVFMSSGIEGYVMAEFIKGV